MASIGRGAAKGILAEIRSSYASHIINTDLERNILRGLYEKSWISNLELEGALLSAVVNEARRSIVHMGRTGEYADHACVYPEHLAYALEKDLLSRREKRIVKRHLDHQKTIEEFCQRYHSPNLLSDLREKLLN